MIWLEAMLAAVLVMVGDQVSKNLVLARRADAERMIGQPAPLTGAHRAVIERSPARAAARNSHNIEI